MRLTCSNRCLIAVVLTRCVYCSGVERTCSFNCIYCLGMKRVLLVAVYVTFDVLIKFNLDAYLEGKFNGIVLHLGGGGIFYCWL